MTKWAEEREKSENNHKMALLQLKLTAWKFAATNVAQYHRKIGDFLLLFLATLRHLHKLHCRHYDRVRSTCALNVRFDNRSHLEICANKSNDDFITTRHHHRRLIGENICECLRAAGKCISTHFRIREKKSNGIKWNGIKWKWKEEKNETKIKSKQWQSK